MNEMNDQELMEIQGGVSSDTIYASSIAVAAGAIFGIFVLPAAAPALAVWGLIAIAGAADASAIAVSQAE